MSYYLKVPITKKLFKSPLRSDRIETCSFHKKNGILKFHDFAMGLDLDFIGVVMEKFRIDYYSAINMIANDFNIISVPNMEKNIIEEVYNGEILEKSNPCKINVEIKDFSASELHYWESFGISIQTLQKFHVYSLKTVFLKDYPSYFSSESSPIFGYYFGVKDGLEQWKIYFPKKLKYRFLLNTSAIQGLHMLPKTGDLLIITKALKDAMCLYELGYNAIAPQSENTYIKEKEFENLRKRFKKIYLLYDSDLPGISSMQRFRKKYQVEKCIWIPRRFSKDISDLYRKYGSEKTLNLINNWQRNQERKEKNLYMME